MTRPRAPASPAGLGGPPAYFDADDRQCWRELEDACPPWLLRASDTPAAEMLARLYARSRRNELTVGEKALLLRLLRQFGLTPAARAQRWYRELHGAALTAELEAEEAGETAATAGERRKPLALARRRRGRASAVAALKFPRKSRS